MAKIVLISCVSKKLSHESKAEDLYVSPLFRKELEYARHLKPDKIFILSAKYGLLKLDEKVKPYDKSLNKMSSEEIKKWADSVINKLKEVSDLKNDEFIFLAGSKYRKFLLPHIKHYKVPMQRMRIGKQLKWLSERSRNE